jgi:hypothetical protein
MDFSACFDTAIALNTSHHIIGSSVESTYANLREFMNGGRACLEDEGKLVFIESTMPRWFVRLNGLCE